jgi:hypothetical protein
MDIIESLVIDEKLQKLADLNYEEVSKACK